MINSISIFVTLSLVILVGVSFWLKIPRTTIPLAIIYLVFMFLNPFDSQKSYENNTMIETKPINPDKIIIKPMINSRPIQPVETDIKPQNLTFKYNPNKKNLPNTKQEILESKPQSDIEKESNKVEEKQKDILRLRDIQICKNVINRIPVGTDVYFSKNVDSLYCYTRIQNTGGKQEVKHAWYYEDRLMTQIRYNIKKSNIYRSWTKKTILRNQIGKWRVDVLDSDGTIIGSKKFEIINSISPS